MIKNKITFVLGAGASIPYGFPSGKKLKEIIIRDVGHVEWRGLFKRLGFSHEMCLDFKNSFEKSGVNSVDVFLEHRNDYLNIGKLCIARALIPFEDENRLYQVLREDKGWYSYVFEKLITDFDNLSQNNLSIITFNYDRSFEHFLFTSMKNLYNESNEEVARAVSSINIIHVHGQLGKLPWQANENEKQYVRDYNEAIQDERVKSAADQIVIVSEGDDTSESFNRAYEILSESQRVYFLGFGYNDVNLRRLRIKQLQNPRIQWGTSHGLMKSERESINRNWSIELFEDHNEIIDFLKERVHF